MSLEELSEALAKAPEYKKLEEHVRAEVTEMVLEQASKEIYVLHRKHEGEKKKLTNRQMVIQS
ncbi:hypothetical protein A1F94_006716 [Pyrenophora tritici-repentis]|nr:hypothetical protein A1F94_006716 [Pyrenophora tritici-repentis]